MPTRDQMIKIAVKTGLAAGVDKLLYNRMLSLKRAGMDAGVFAVSEYLLMDMVSKLLDIMPNLDGNVKMFVKEYASDLVSKFVVDMVSGTKEPLKESLVKYAIVIVAGGVVKSLSNQKAMQGDETDQ